jgi:oxygen-independent coproporphyrinogen-3 oxidase
MAIAQIPEYLRSVNVELEQRKFYLGDDIIETIYIGGGTPSLLTIGQINELISKVYANFRISEHCEITLEANPDDLSFDYLKELAGYTQVNRLSIGIQSFRDSDLELLSRRHSAAQAYRCISDARKAGFHNLSIDLIYGIPGLQMDDWKKNLEMAVEADHISAYHLTIEEGTRLSKYVTQGRIAMPDDESSMNQFSVLHDILMNSGFAHYEISNFAKPGYISKHNSNYWKGIKYLGLGPSAHSYDGMSRQWNVRNLNAYIRAIGQGTSFFERELLSEKDRFNEYIMVSLRTQWGIYLPEIKNSYGAETYQNFLQAINPFIHSGHMVIHEEVCKMTPKGWLISDYIIANLFKA